MTLILAATADRARALQRVHDAAEGGWWCTGCHRAGDGKIAAGTCEPWTAAEAVLAAYAAQRPARARVPVGARLWHRD